MTDHLREGGAADFPALAALWRTAFGDDAAFVDAFLAQWGARARCFLAAREGETVGGLWALPCTVADAPAYYLYAVAVRPDARRQGVASALLAFARDTLAGEGIARLWLYPAQTALHDLYRPLGFAPAPSARRLVLPAAPQGVARCPLTPAEAAARRAALLQDKRAVGWDAEALAWAAFSEGGAWYAVGEGLAMLCPEGETLRSPEWLADPALAAGCAASLGCRRAEVILPSWRSEGDPLPPPLAWGDAPRYAGLVLA